MQRGLNVPDVPQGTYFSSPINHAVQKEATEASDMVSLGNYSPNTHSREILARRAGAVGFGFGLVCQEGTTLILTTPLEVDWSVGLSVLTYNRAVVDF